jgi:hypothetical protein
MKTMANYNATIRTNYFSVTDEARFRKIIANCCGSDENLMLFEAEDDSGKFGFGCYGSVLGIPVGEDDYPDYDIDAFYEALQEILSDGDAIIITEVGHEKLRYLLGVCTVITKREIRSIDLSVKAIALAGEMLGNADFMTRMDY